MFLSTFPLKGQGSFCKEITKYFFWHKAKTFKVGIEPGNGGMAFFCQHFLDIIYILYVFVTSGSRIIGL